MSRRQSIGVQYDAHGRRMAAGGPSSPVTGLPPEAACAATQPSAALFAGASVVKVGVEPATQAAGVSSQSSKPGLFKPEASAAVPAEDSSKCQRPTIPSGLI